MTYFRFLVMTDNDLVAAKVEVFKFLKLVCNEVCETYTNIPL